MGQVKEVKEYLRWKFKLSLIDFNLPTQKFSVPKQEKFYK